MAVMVKCPGQDSRYWSPEDIFEANCPQCTASIEFWKDEVSRKCPHCGQVVQNPKIDLSCAEWCHYGPQCTGTLPGKPNEDSICNGYVSLCTSLVA